MTSPSHSHISSSTSSASPFSRQRPTQAPMPPPGSNSFTPAYNPLSSPCFVHSHLDSAVSGSARRGGNHSEAHPNSSSAMTLGGAASNAYFDGEHGMQSRLEGPSGGRDLANGLAINSTPAATAGSNGTASPLRQRNHRPNQDIEAHKLGGDGTVLFCSWLFQRIVPPVMPFALGSLGFLTNFEFNAYKKVMKSALDTGIRVNLRMRFTATVYRATLPSSQTADRKRRRAISTKPVETFEVLNDLVVDRGPSPYVSLLEVFGDEHHMTTAQADGLCISTPTGSTAYSVSFSFHSFLVAGNADMKQTWPKLSAGGSLVHPEIPAILITPICPHTLSFRPMLLPDSMELRIAVPYNSRSTAWASFDGRGRVELKQGDHIKVTASRYPFPTVCNENQSKDWFESISRTLKWNERQRQKSFVVVEEGEDDETDRKKDRVKNASKKIEAMQREKREALDKRPKDDGAAQVQHEKQRAELGLDGDDDDEVDEEEDEEEEEETFDIDDTSAAATRASSPMQRASSSGSRRSSQGQDVGNSRLRTSSSQGALPNLSRLHPLTSTKDQGSEKRRESQRNESESSTPSSAGTGKFMPYQHGVIQPSTGRSILDSPDRFGLPGPPNPPRAISERHLATADFRLDDEDEPSMLPPPEQPAKNNNPSAEGAKRMDGAAPLSPSSTSISVAREPLSAAAAAVQGAAEALKARQVSPAEHTGSSSTVSPSQTTTTSSRERSSSSRRRPRSKSLRLKSSDNASNTVNMNGIEESATSGSSGGTALVVYGQDESDSDSTAEG
ncbi:hypothetical protein L7F22_058843 [Adiantum nelumboides]|nr:hypothetical protein [Adiantum nelumboides]